MKEATTGRYRVVERIAQGGMAVVDRAVSVGPDGFEKELVIKRIRPKYSRSRRFARMFIDEARIVSQLIHPNIVQIFEFGKVDDEYFIAMEYVPGVDLDSLRKKLADTGRGLPLGLGMFIVIEVCRALDYAHRKRGADGQPLNIVHRDVSPQNVLLSYEGGVKLADFGIARATERKEQTVDGIIKGKVAFMPPEQLLGDTLDGRCDIYAAALILHTLISGRHPYAQKSETATVEAALAHNWPPPSALVPRIPAEVDAIVVRGTAADREQRHATAGEMAEALEQVVFNSRLRASGRELSALMKELYGEEPLAPPPPERVALDGIVASELRRLVGGPSDLPTYTQAASNTGSSSAGSSPAQAASGPAKTSPAAGLSRGRTQALHRVAAPAVTPEPSGDEQDTTPTIPSRPELSSPRLSGTGLLPDVPGVGPSPTVPAPQDTAPGGTETGLAKGRSGRRGRAGGVAALVTVFLLLSVGGFLAGAFFFGERPPVHSPDTGLATIHHHVTPEVGVDAQAPMTDAGLLRAVDAKAPMADVGVLGAVDARGQADAQAQDPRQAQSRVPSPRPIGAKGWLRVSTVPHYAEIYVDGRFRGNTPKLLSVRAGRRKVRLVNPHLGKTQTHTVAVSGDHTKTTPAVLAVRGF